MTIKNKERRIIINNFNPYQCNNEDGSCMQPYSYYPYMNYDDNEDYYEYYDDNDGYDNYEMYGMNYDYVDMDMRVQDDFAEIFMEFPELQSSRPPFAPPGQQPSFGPPGQQPPFGPPMGQQPPFGPPQAQQPNIFLPGPQGPSFRPPVGLPWQTTQRIRRCMHRISVVTLNNNSSFWYYPTDIRRQRLFGFRWRRNRWEPHSIELFRILRIRCN